MKVRLNRRESKCLTRKRLLSAARLTFVMKGFVASSIEDITKEAGFTRGAFYSNFNSKTELLLELLRQEHDTVMAELHSISEMGGEPERMRMLAVEYYSRLPRNSDGYALWIEAKAQAMCDVGFRESLKSLVREQRNKIASFIIDFAGMANVSLKLPPDVLALGLISLGEGIQSAHAIDPASVSREVAETALASFLAKIVLGDR